MLTNRINKQRLQQRLLDWFAHNQRDFPWRHTREPYAVLIAEKLLQQTAAKAVVVEAYVSLLNRYPNPLSLASADVTQIAITVRPLGLSYRALELSVLAEALVELHGGAVPSDLKALLALPGVGDYTARAVLSFAYGDDVPVVDTNVARFLYRLYGIPGRLPSNPARKMSLIEIAKTLVPAGKSRDYNLAILDLCALLCKPGEPLCHLCPVRRYCSYGLACLAAKRE